MMNVADIEFIKLKTSQISAIRIGDAGEKNNRFLPVPDGKSEIGGKIFNGADIDFLSFISTSRAL